MRRAVGLYRAYASLAFSFAWVPVMYMAFARDRGFGPGGYFRLWSAYYLAMVLAEVPWGVVADRFGKRLLLVAGPLGLAASFVVLGHATSFEACLVAMAATGACHAMISGADSAWFYEALARAGRADEALRQEAVAFRCRMLGVSVADVAGGHAAAAGGTGAAFDLSALFMLGAATCAVLLPRTDGSVPLPKPRWIRARVALRRSGVLWTFGWYASVFLLLRVGFQLYQPTLLAVGVAAPERHGWTFAALNLVAAGATLLVAPLHRRLGERAAATAVLLTLAVAFGGLVALRPWLVVPLFCLVQVSFGFLEPLGRTALNRRIPFAERASLLSVQSLLARLAFALVLFAGGIHHETAPLRLAPLYVGLAAFALLAATLAHRTHRARRLKTPRAPATLGDRA